MHVHCTNTLYLHLELLPSNSFDKQISGTVMQHVWWCQWSVVMGQCCKVSQLECTRPCISC